MEQNTTIQRSNVWTEVRVTGNGVSVTLYTENESGMPVVEGETWLTHEELTEPELIGGPGKRELLSISGDRPAEPEETEEYDVPAVGSFVVDDNPPSWSDNNVLQVKRIPGETAGEHVIQERFGTRSDKTVADANPRYDADAPVVVATYVNGNNEPYAFPSSRLLEVPDSISL